MIKSFCHQICYTTDNYRHHIPDDYASVKKHFVHSMQKGEFQGLLVILIDGLNHLSPDDDCFRLDWLPTKIAPNVKIIVSTTNYVENMCVLEQVSTAAEDYRGTECDLLMRLRRKITSDDQYLELEGNGEMAPCIQLQTLYVQYCALYLF